MSLGSNGLSLMKVIPRQNFAKGTRVTVSEMGRFPDDFVFGVATAAYQIEGAFGEGSRIASHWDTFSHTPGKTYRGETGDVACDYYHRYRDDVALLKELGVSSYRFSFAWPRILDEDGQVNPKGVDFYHRVIDELDKIGVATTATIYHWDLPQWIANRGGWANRDTVNYFVDYAQVLFREYGGRIFRWITHNEPWCQAFLGYGYGVHAPGHANWDEAVKASHHLLLSHGQAVQAFRALGLKGDVGISLNLNVVDPASNTDDDHGAARRGDGFQNRWFLDPLFLGSYPTDMMDLFLPHVKDYRFIQPGDLKIIAEPIDFLGVNYYNRAVLKDAPQEGIVRTSGVLDPEAPVTAMGWEVHPTSLYRLLMRINRDYTQLPLYITENGAAYPDVVDSDGRVHDLDRVAFLKTHLQSALDAISDGSTLKGYYVWSLMDNYEWAEGYAKRFGIVYVDFESQQRIWKDSALWYRELIDQQRR